LDAQDEVLYWVRNLALQKDASCGSKHTRTASTPIFVAVLKDGRTLVVEYKGGRDSDSPGTLSDRSLGEKYQDKSGGKALFLDGCLARRAGTRDLRPDQEQDRGNDPWNGITSDRRAPGRSGFGQLGGDLFLGAVGQCEMRMWVSSNLAHQKAV